MSLYPQRALVLPSELIGKPNGQLPSSLLVPIDDGPARMAPTPARGMRALIAAFQQATGATLSYTSTAYRSLAAQIAVFEARTSVIPDPKAPWKRTWNGRVYYAADDGNGNYPAPVATPGTSNHGLGRAIDVALLVGGQVVGITANASAFKWLVTNATSYGFCWESDEEPWHLSWFPGDAIPAAVLTFERPPLPGANMTIFQGAGTGVTPPQTSFPYAGNTGARWFAVIHPDKGSVLVPIYSSPFLDVMYAAGEVKNVPMGLLDKAPKMDLGEYQAYLAACAAKGGAVDTSQLATKADLKPLATDAHLSAVEGTVDTINAKPTADVDVGALAKAVSKAVVYPAYDIPSVPGKATPVPKT